MKFFVDNFQMKKDYQIIFEYQKSLYAGKYKCLQD